MLCNDVNIWNTKPLVIDRVKRLRAETLWRSGIQAVNFAKKLAQAWGSNPSFATLSAAANLKRWLPAPDFSVLHWTRGDYLPSFSFLYPMQEPGGVNGCS